MNPLKKLKLKSQLRNCDYILAGTVIKQQYYDTNKTSVVNRLIDDFLANPGFETALKLIEYNDMMVFYFTESCEGGLYVRKTVSEPAKPAAPPAADIHEVEEPQPPARKVETILSDDTLVRFGVVRDEDPKRLEREQRHRQILQQSDEWMEELLARAATKEPEPRIASYRKPAPDPEPELEPELEPEYESVPASMPYSEQEYIPLLEESAIAEAAAAAYEPEPVPEPFYEPILQPKPESQPDSFVLEESLPPRTAKKRAYPNVIATLKIDIHTMVKQLEEYRRELSFYPSNEKQLIAWIKSLEDAIEEFSQVVDLLEDQE